MATTTIFIRKIRPYSKLIVSLFWIGYRFGSFVPFANLLSSLCDSGNQECRSQDVIGILDLLLRIYHGCETFLLQNLDQISRSDALHSIISKGFLYMNDFLGIFLFLSCIRIANQQIVMRIYSPDSIFTSLKDDIFQSAFEFAKDHIPTVRKELLKEEAKMQASLEKSLWSGRTNVLKKLPKNGIDQKMLLESLEKSSKDENKKWEEGLVSGAVYGGEVTHNEILNKAYSLYSLSNPLHPDIWPKVNQCEAEVIAMTANLLNGGDQNVVGTMTSGGTESIIMAVRAHLEYYGNKRGIEYPCIVSSKTAHAGLNKACEMFGISLIQIDCGDEDGYVLKAAKVRKCMTSNVIMIYSSAPCFPQGVIDPIEEELSDLAVEYDVGLHVDACLGGFVLPFAKMLNYDIPNFDFGCAGVTSMSADTHKYGYASKGTSVVLYRNKHLRRCQFFNYAKWTGGLYTTPTIAGSRAGALIASAWASLVLIGEEGFKSRVKMIIDATQYIANEVSQIKGIRLLGCNPNPHAMIVCFESSDKILNIYQVVEVMTKLGWSLNSLQHPACIHLCVTLKTVEHKDKFVRDLRSSVETLIQNPIEQKEGSSAAIYGATGSMPAGPVNELLKVYTDVTLSC